MSIRRACDLTRRSYQPSRMLFSLSYRQTMRHQTFCFTEKNYSPKEFRRTRESNESRVVREVLNLFQGEVILADHTQCDNETF